MLSTLPASTFPSDPLLGNPFSAFDGGFPPWECPDIFSAFKHTKPVNSSSGSDELNQNHAKTKSDSDEPNRTNSVTDERKRRRMISNRESARRSRMRKQKHLENLRIQMNRFKMENRELSNRLRFILYHSRRTRTENDQLQSEHIMLRQKLSDISQILIFQQLQPFSSAWPHNSTITPE
ncbi:Basic-leucine zipper transcription factor [Quillaja saponaria]|uniref:Basic-leucine zipper transcription factor n=1 Tax=Quillaja saponaria TaxID=32244 RepID=A0AAD7PEI5_QUISA|nr:Basic-leucine zipper transcription factor [Quillaja saponaria]